MTFNIKVKLEYTGTIMWFLYIIAAIFDIIAAYSPSHLADTDDGIVYVHGINNPVHEIFRIASMYTFVAATIVGIIVVAKALIAESKSGNR